MRGGVQAARTARNIALVYDVAQMTGPDHHQATHDALD